MIECSKCGATNREDSYFCKSCGTKLFLLPKEVGPHLEQINDKIKILRKDLERFESATKASKVMKNLEELREKIDKLASRKEFEEVKKERKEALEDLKGKLDKQLKAFNKKISARLEEAREELFKPNLCPQCGIVNEKDASFCVKCGAELK